MKHFKKLLVSIIALCTAVCALALTACTGDNRQSSTDTVENGHKIYYAFTADKDVMTINENSSVYDYMLALKDKNFLTFEYTGSGKDLFITSILGIGSVSISSTSNSYTGWDWMIYTTITSIDGTTYSDDSSSCTIEGITYYMSSYGASGLPCVEGESYVWVYQLSTMTW
jgi:hypothetical protein